MKDTPEAIRRDAAALAVAIGSAKAQAEQDRVLLAAAARKAESVLRRASAAVSETAMTAAMEQIDPAEFQRRVQVRRRRDALRGKRS